MIATLVASLATGKWQILWELYHNPEGVYLTTFMVSDYSDDSSNTGELIGAMVTLAMP